MLRVRAVATLVCVLTLTAPAAAAERTAVLMFATADLGLRYDGKFLIGQQVEGVERSRTVATYGHTFMDVGLVAEIGILPGVEFNFDLPFRVYDVRRFTDSNTLGFDPEGGFASFATGTGTVAADDLFSVTRRGIGDLWLGLTGSPYNEDFERPSFGTLVFDFGIKVPTAQRIFKKRLDGALGFGTGAVDLRFGTGFSKRWREVEPYIWADYLYTGGFKSDLVGDQLNVEGEVITAEAELDPADETSLAFGIEATVSEQISEGNRFALDLRFRGAYHSPATWWSGRQLHEVSPNSLGRPAVEDEFLRVGGRIGLYMTVSRHFKIELAGSLDWDTPHMLEMVDRRNYPVRSGAQSYLIGAELRLQGHI
jgi:hypothetical protein